MSPSPAVATPTPIPTAEPLAETVLLAEWIDNYVHAFGGQLRVAGSTMNTDELTRAVQVDPARFVQTRRISGRATPFLVVNGTPLALQSDTGEWIEATLGELGDLNGITFEFAMRGQPPLDMITRIKGKTTILVDLDLGTDLVCRDFAASDWAQVLANWSSIQSSLDAGDVASLLTQYPFDWTLADGSIREGQALFDDPGLKWRSGGLFRGLIPVESLRNLKSAHQLSGADMLKLLEFTVRTKVLRYPEITHWDVEDEVCAAYVQWTVNGLKDYAFWSLATGFSPAQLTLLVAKWVKGDHPGAATYMTEDSMFDFTNPETPWAHDYIYRYLPEVAAGNRIGGHTLVDGFIGENNWWIFEPQNWATVGAAMDRIKRIGFPIASSETIIVTGDVPINGQDDPNRRKLVKITDRNAAQASMYAGWLKLYLQKGVRVIGFSGLGDDRYAWPGDTGIANSNPFFFDTDFRAKESYYAMIDVLYQRLG